MSHGAITVINAIPCGIGAAVGIDMTTNARFRTGGNERTVNIMNDPAEDTGMARICVRDTFRHFGIDEPEGWSLTVDSDIPISRGLKSSSSACNAIVSSVSELISREYGIAGFGASDDDVLEMIRLGVRCAVDAKVTVTGAFDDACACHLGGLVITDNGNNTLLKRARVKEHDVILLVPEKRIRKHTIDRERFRMLADDMARLAKVAERDWYSALIENGSLVARAVGADNSIADRAMDMGAAAAGMSGTGPAISIVVKKNEGPSFLNDLDHCGHEAIVTRTR
jgi:shikimate kinase